MLRRSISCAAAGLLIATPFWLFASQGLDWLPHKVVAASAITLGITGWIWLWDEVNAP